MPTRSTATECHPPGRPPPGSFRAAPVESRCERAEYPTVSPRVPDTAAPAADAPLASLHAFVATLLERCTALRALGHPALGGADTDAFLSALTLARAALRLVASPAAAARPPQLAVIGPTQAGKSTVVNLLLGRAVAGVSPLAGFTVHPQAFHALPQPATPAPPVTLCDDPPAAPSDGWLGAVLPGWARVAASGLRRDERPACACTAVAAPTAELAGSVTRDTPDFDSLAAHRYRAGLLEIGAAADAYVLVVSKEKYADQAVWNVVRLLEPLGRPLVVVLNKVSDDAAAVLTRAVGERLAEQAGGWGRVPVVVLPFDPAIEARGAALPAVDALRDAVAAALRTPRGRHAAGVCALLRRHWDDWTAPLRVEHAALDEWRACVEGRLAALLAAYERGYLEHPERYEDFRRATAELLVLLELPKVGRGIAAVRQGVTWLPRQLLARGRAWLERNPRPPTRARPASQAFLVDELDQLLSGLQAEAQRRAVPSAADGPLWQALAHELTTTAEPLTTRLHADIDALTPVQARAVQTAANRLYSALQERPAVLNSLRTARLALDLAGLVVAVKTGGVPLTELLWAPPMFALTSLLTEGALGTYMRHVAADLKRAQLDLVRTQLVDAAVRPALHGLTAQLTDERLFGITPDELAAAAAALTRAEEQADG